MFGRKGDCVTTDPPVAPIATTDAAMDVGFDSATLRGRVDPQESPATAWFEYAKTTAYGSATAGRYLRGGTDDVALATGLGSRA